MALFYKTVNVTGGGSVEYLGDRYEVSVGFAVAAVWESLIYFDRVENCQALKVLLGISSMASRYLEGRI